MQTWYFSVAAFIQNGYNINMSKSIGGLVKKKHAQILALAKKHGVLNIRLFGSVAKNEDKKSSDVDFLVEMTKGSTLFDIIALKQDMEDMLGVKVDIVTVASLSPYIREDVLKEVVNL